MKPEIDLIRETLEGCWSKLMDPDDDGSDYQKLAAFRLAGKIRERLDTATDAELEEFFIFFVDVMRTEGRKRGFSEIST